jgi:hypothetical protein
MNLAGNSISRHMVQRLAWPLSHDISPSIGYTVCYGKRLVIVTDRLVESLSA